jgi:peptidoglycan/xylan/chitin deacetylase (PgdA/CDA1 family)
MTGTRALAEHALGVAAVRQTATTVAALRGHSLVLVFHRITSDDCAPQCLMPSVPESLFRRQIELLGEIGEIVALEALLAPAPANRHRPRFAVTFDDDLVTHYERALPILRDVGVTATFFLSGRSLHGLGPLWFAKLDGLVAAHGLQTTAHLLGLDAKDCSQLAAMSENDRVLQHRIDELPHEDIPQITGVQIRALVDAGMTIGFHTLEHHLVTLLSDSELDSALTQGRRELEAVVGRPLRLFAYPHGKPDSRTPGRLRAAGFHAACTGRPVPVRPGDDPYLLGRWEPGPIALDRFVVSLAVRLNGWSRRQSGAMS